MKQCPNCSEGTTKLSSKILAHAKVSIAKHLKETNEREATKVEVKPVKK